MAPGATKAGIWRSALGSTLSTARSLGDTNLRYTNDNYNANPRGAAFANASPNNDWWQGQLVAAAERACRARGARYVAGSAQLGPGHSENRGSGAQDVGPGLGLFFRRVTNPMSSSAFRYQTRQSRTWEATMQENHPPHPEVGGRNRRLPSRKPFCRHFPVMGDGGFSTVLPAPPFNRPSRRPFLPSFPPSPTVIPA